MKRYQKIAAMVLALALVLSSLTACGDKAPKPRTAGEVGKDAVSMLETKLSEEEMRAAIDGYADSLTQALADGSAVAKFVDNKDGSVALVVQPDGIDKTQELMKFGSVKEAFAYFVYTGQMDADGKIIIPPVVQTSNDDSIVSDTSEVASETASAPASEVTSEVTAESTPEVVAPESAPADSVAAPLPETSAAP